MIVIAGSASPKLSARVARRLECRLLKPELQHFPDGELYLKLGTELKGEHAVVVQSTRFPQDLNLMELFLLLDAAKDTGASRVTAVVPYFAYARQDKRFKPGEAVSLKTVVKLIQRAGADDIVAVDIHEEETVRDFPLPAKNFTAMPLLGRYLKKLGLRSPLALGADQGSEERAKIVGDEFGAEHDYLEKHRLTPTKVATKPKKLDVSGRDVVIVDDIISTGGSMVEAAKILQHLGARSIRAACTHAVLVGNAHEKLKAAGIKEIIATDTIETPFSVVSVSPLIEEAVR